MSPQEAVRTWVLERGRNAAGDLTSTTPLFETRHLTSLQVPELLLYLESLRGAPIDVEALRAGDFRDIETICHRFLGEEA